ncbi:MAG: PAS domain-containing protein [Thiotrichales bacterium]|nr:PAS domain-containing protein [Thiotrichales bacterium]
MNSFTIVGIGASAGGLAAFESFFLALSKEKKTGMAFVLVQHLSPEHKSLLVDLVQSYTEIPVLQVTAGMCVEPDHIYVIPPNYEMTLHDGHFQLGQYPNLQALHLPIDTFFRSLAEQKKQMAIAIILSGMGSDGTQGILAIKRAGGTIIVQDPEGLEFNAMPKSAIATGLVDYILPAEKMPKLLKKLDEKVNPMQLKQGSIHPNNLSRLFKLLQERTGHDFSGYKHSTIYRRIESRMAVKQFDTFVDYFTYLQTHADEVDALFANLLIGVTQFFRDRNAFKALKQLFESSEFKKRSVENPLRIWVCACSTGEEVYSIAMLLQEALDQDTNQFTQPNAPQSNKQNTAQAKTVQIFATDIDDSAIKKARAGLYPLSIAKDISPARLKRFFVAETDGSGYRVQKQIRNMVVFSEHDVVKDPPFSKLNLICCRNLLIYMSDILQKRVLSTFHFALRDKGHLFLGSSESLGKLEPLFATVDQKAKIFKKKTDAYAVKNLPFLALNLPKPHSETQPENSFQKRDVMSKLPLKEFTEQAILKHMAPSAALITEKGDTLYVHGRLGKFFEVQPGIVGVSNLLQMANEGLKTVLPLLLIEAKQKQTVIRRQHVQVKTDNKFSLVNLTIRAIGSSLLVAADLDLYVVIIDEVLETTQTNADLPTLNEMMVEADNSLPDSDERIEALRQALRIQERFLQEANEKLETSNVELKSYNEEMQSMNEELQSTNEELETSKEELQSVNEELTTVNAELQTKVTDLSHTNNDMNNLLAGTGIGTLFIDYKLNIMRYTPAATKIINLIESDIGRPVSHLVSNLENYSTLMEDINEVLKTLIPIEREVMTHLGKWYLLRIQPYRTLENVIEGAVFSFINISDIVQLREELAESKLRTEQIGEMVHAQDAYVIQDLEGHILAWNPAAEKLYGWTFSEALKLNLKQFTADSSHDNPLEKMKEYALKPGLNAFNMQKFTKNGDIIEVSIISSALMDENRKTYAYATTERLI